MNEYDVIAPHIDAVLTHMQQRLEAAVSGFVAIHKVKRDESHISVSGDMHGPSGWLEIIVRNPPESYTPSKSVHNGDWDSCAGRHVLSCVEVVATASAPMLNKRAADVVVLLHESQRMARLMEEAERVTSELLHKRLYDIGREYRRGIGEE